MKLGIGEILIILVVILFIVGPDKIPDFAKKVAEGLRAFRTATSGVTKELRENVIEPLNEAQAPLREAMEPINEIRAEIGTLTSGLKKDAQEIADSFNKEVQEVTDELNKTGHAMKEAAEKAVAQAETLPVKEPEEAEEAKEAEEAVLPLEEADIPSAEEVVAEAAAEPVPEEEAAQLARLEAERRVAEAEKALQEAKEALKQAETPKELPLEDKSDAIEEEIT